MQLLPGQVTEYTERHNPIWAELAAVLKDHGVHNYSIHLAGDGLTLFGYAEIESEERWAAIASTEVCQRWWAHMAPLMRTNPDNSPISHELREVFFLP